MPSSSSPRRAATSPDAREHDIERMQREVWERAAAEGLEDGDVMLPLTRAQREEATASVLSKVSVPLVFGTSNRAIRRAAHRVDVVADAKKRPPLSPWHAFRASFRAQSPAVLLAVILVATVLASVLPGEGWFRGAAFAGFVVLDLLIRAAIEARRDHDEGSEQRRRG
jgi:hypothetical protein